MFPNFVHSDEILFCRHGNALYQQREQRSYAHTKPRMGTEPRAGVHASPLHRSQEKLKRSEKISNGYAKIE